MKMLYTNNIGFSFYHSCHEHFPMSLNILELYDFNSIIIYHVIVTYILNHFLIFVFRLLHCLSLHFNLSLNIKLFPERNKAAYFIGFLPKGL